MSYREVLVDQFIHPLLSIAALILDFQCLHPFRRGQTRMAHLLALLSLYQNGFEVGRFISLERCFERSRENYSNALRLSSEGWREGRHDLDPWMAYFFDVIRHAYREFEQVVCQVKSPRGAKTALVETAIDGFPARFGACQRV